MKITTLTSELRNLFKLFQNDVGLLAAQYAQEIAMQILTGDVNINYGAIYENFVAQELQAHGWALRYFNSKKQGEVDFVIEEGPAMPVRTVHGVVVRKRMSMADPVLSVILSSTLRWAKFLG